MISTNALPIHWRNEGEIVPDGLSITKARRLHIIYQEHKGEKVFRVRIAIPCFIPDNVSVKEFLQEFVAETEEME